MNEYLIAHIGHSLSDSEHICWWRPDSRGYTICIDTAGHYGEEDALSICKSSLCIAVRYDDAAKLSKPTPYYRRSNGELAKLYDGEKHVVVPNGKDEWRSLMAARIDLGKKEKPTPIGAKARAIYLPRIQQ